MEIVKRKFTKRVLYLLSYFFPILFYSYIKLFYQFKLTNFMFTMSSASLSQYFLLGWFDLTLPICCFLLHLNGSLAMAALRLMFPQRFWRQRYLMRLPTWISLNLALVVRQGKFETPKWLSIVRVLVKFPLHFKGWAFKGWAKQCIYINPNTPLTCRHVTSRWTNKHGKVKWPNK